MADFSSRMPIEFHYVNTPIHLLAVDLLVCSYHFKTDVIWRCNYFFLVFNLHFIYFFCWFYLSPKFPLHTSLYFFLYHSIGYSFLLHAIPNLFLPLALDVLFISMFSSIVRSCISFLFFCQILVFFMIYLPASFPIFFFNLSKQKA